MHLLVSLGSYASLAWVEGEVEVVEGEEGDHWRILAWKEELRPDSEAVVEVVVEEDRIRNQAS